MLGGVLIGEEPLPWSGPIFSHQISGERKETGQTSQCCLLPGNVWRYYILSVRLLSSLYAIRYGMISECWEVEPWKRPHFSQLVTVISTSLEGMAGYLDLNSPSPNTPLN